VFPIEKLNSLTMKIIIKAAKGDKDSVFATSQRIIKMFEEELDKNAKGIPKSYTLTMKLIIKAAKGDKDAVYQVAQEMVKTFEESLEEEEKHAGSS
jgi:hypothetical protein